ncbi:hypothetical protein [Mycobacterium simiae]|uniref:hypothetical protein n=1 Tax=Mycobacterium simiae TaxID=1784 RepID=UPI001CB6C5E8|nr:hypothetical protein [Mycobacterium simiae]
MLFERAAQQRVGITAGDGSSRPWALVSTPAESALAVISTLQHARWLSTVW